MSRNKQIDWNSASYELGLEALEITRQMSIAMMEYSRSLWALQLDTATRMGGEASRQLRYWLQDAAANGDALGQWPGFFYPRTQKFIEITQGWLDTASQTGSEINELFGQALKASLAAAEGVQASGYPYHERRTSAQVISFPDRRRSAGHHADTAPRQRTRSA